MLTDPNKVILDSSKITEYMGCPRRFFYKYVLNWQPEESNIHLIFGEAFHRAKEYLFINGGTVQNVKIAMELFNDYYSQHFSTIPNLNSVKTPGKANEALLHYIKTYGNIHDTYTPVLIGGKPATELYGTVPISADRLVHFRIDAIMREIKLNKIVVFDHKTASRDSAMYQIQWTISTQMLLYLHATNTIFNPNSVYGLVVDITIIRKNDVLQVRILVKKTIDFMNEWLIGLNRWVDSIFADYKLLEDNIQKGMQMTAFRKNSTNCTKWNRLCPYFDFCTAWYNPLEKIGTVPQGLVINEWDPGKPRDGKTSLTL